MEYILDAGKAVTCFNLTAKANPCMNVYCQNCIIAYMEEKHHFDEKEEGTKKETNAKDVDEEAKKAKEMENRKIRRKLWLKAS